MFTLFGDVVRPCGGNAWLTTLTACMRTLGFTPEATRTALHRMATDGWVAPTKVGRFAAYRLTDAGVGRLEEAAARIYRLRAAEWDGRWHLLVCPAAGRNAALARELQWTGHGRLSADVWVSPHPQGARLARLLQAHEVTGVRFDTATGAEAADNDTIVTTAWDLTELAQAHAEFLATWEGTAPPDEDEAAFAMRLRLVHHWRSFLFLDPGLPAQLLPDGWLGDRAAEQFRSLYEGLAEPSWRYYDQLTATAPPLSGAGPEAGVHPLRPRGDNPFVHGLDALTSSRPA